LVTFRVSAEEYDALTKSCIECGSRSIAEFARAAALQKIQNLHVPAGNLSGDLTTLTKGLRELDFVLGDIRKRIRRVLGPAGEGVSLKKEDSVAPEQDRQAD
jgi:hypothetical protein